MPKHGTMTAAAETSGLSQPAIPDLLAESVLQDRIVAFVPPGDPLLREAPMLPSRCVVANS